MQDIEEFVKTCPLCIATGNRVKNAPMEERETPDDVWQHVSADFKGLLAGGYYLYVMIDNLSWFPMVQMTETTSFSAL